MKLPILAAIAFVVGVLGGTGIGVMRAPKAAAGAAGADSSAHAKPAPAAGAHADARPAGEPTGTDAVAASAHGAPVSVAHADSSATAATALSASDHGEPGAARGSAPPGGASAVPAAMMSAASAPIVSTAHADAVREPEDFRQVARILTTMKPTDAAKILAFLGDDLVEGIVREVGPRQAAVLMVQIPPQRAAGLSKRLIQHPTPEAK